MNNKSLFITFDGPNGCGKTTLIDNVFRILENKGLDILKTKEPTNTKLGQFIRDSELCLNGKCLACLVAADRHAHIEQEIIPALKQNKIILCDRYIESSLVLQILDGLSTDYIFAINEGIIVPDISIIIVAPEYILNERMTERTTISRFEKTRTRKEELDLYYNSVKILTSKGYNIMLVDNGLPTVNENSNNIAEIILNIYKGE